MMIFPQPCTQIIYHLFPECNRLDDLYVWCVRFGELLHRKLIHVGGHGDLLLALVAELDVLTKHVDDVAEHEFFGTEHGTDILA